MSEEKLRELANHIAEARLWLERDDIDGAKACLDGAAGLIPDSLWPEENDVLAQMGLY